MEILYLLIPLSLLLVGLIVWIFLWAVRSGQFDDMEGPAHQILMDDDDPVIGKGNEDAGGTGDNAGNNAVKPESPAGSPTSRQNR
jgi:cbb3-type cytochrome oxidase maturation protein